MFIIREANKSDISQLRQLFECSASDHRSHVSRTVVVSDEQLENNGFSDDNTNKWQFRTLVAQLNDNNRSYDRQQQQQLIGYIIYSNGYTIIRGKGICIEDLYVRDEYTIKLDTGASSGVGRALLSSLAKQAVTSDITFMELNCFGWDDHFGSIFKSLGIIDETIEMSSHSFGMTGEPLKQLANSVVNNEKFKSTFTVQKAIVEDKYAVRDLFKKFAEFNNRDPETVVSVEQIDRDGFGERSVFRTVILKHNTSEQIVGFALYYPTFTPFNGLGVCMEYLYVCPEFRGSGSGRALMAAVANESANDGYCNYFRWGCFMRNTDTIAFYKRIGGTDWTETKNIHNFFIYGNNLIKLINKTITEQTMSSASSSPFIIRPGVKSDCPSIRAMIVSLMDHIKVDSNEMPVQSVEQLEEYGFCDQLDKRKFYTLLIGMALYIPHFSPCLGKGISLIDLIVDEKHRRSGIGRALMETLAKYAVRENWEYIYWNCVASDVKAMTFYKSLGAKDFSETYGFHWLALRGDDLKQLADNKQ
ncbi:uncharacterized protein LOC128954047 [Oppia nitens]|uniref:uncharacterized protein LOC128954047 n=1 Tax=Oppia nitens TaxID=1686743 RepID=UPI0023DA7F83|nr:uncharacterized protein LOC128954047 [Oppia nitens]